MVSQVFTSVEVMSSIVLGGATLGAAALNLAHEARKAKRTAREYGSPQRAWLRRPLIVLGIAIALVAGWLAYAGGAFSGTGLRIPTFALRKGNSAKTTSTTNGPKEPKPAPVLATALPSVPPGPRTQGRLDDWLQAEGTKLYYRFSRYLPDACPGAPIAVGSWVDGESRPIVATCVDEEWLALDLAPLVAEARIAPNMTYCLNFRAETGAWGLHVPERAPGLDSVAVPATRVPLGHAIGIRYVKGLRERVVPTGEPPRAVC
jgi:hypothetical protein